MQQQPATQQQPEQQSDRAPAHRHQHGTGLWPRRCCDRWPPRNRTTTVRRPFADRRSLMRAATYTGWLILALVAVVAVDALLLPVTTDWASTHGFTGWALWTTWAVGSLAALHQAVIVRTRVGGYAVHAAAVAAVFMAIAAPGGWTRALAATGGTALAWIITYLATRRPWRG